MLRRIAASLVSALAVAAVAHFAAVLAFFAAGGGDPAYFISLSDFFLPASLVAFVLLALFAVLEGYRFWFTAVATGLVASVVAVLAGSMLVIMLDGTVIGSDVAAYVIQGLGGPHLIFIVAATIAAATLGRRIWKVMGGGQATVSATAERRIALVRLPASNLAEGEVTHIARTDVDTELADHQWENYVEALNDNGWETQEVAVADQHADSVFIEDTVVLFGTCAVIASLGAESRVGESTDVELTIRELGLRVERIELPGTLDGGDVLKVGRTVYVGRGSRTNAEGIRQLRAIISPLGYSVVAVPMSKALHLKTAATALPDGTVIGLPALLDDTSIFERFLAVPEAHGAAVVVLNHDAVLMSRAAPLTAALIADLGYRVVTVDISEFEKLEGCVTCLSVRVR
ncbi:MAG: dimethylarginine dimethylaminohydrolase [Homoserinimonas sp.]|nr:dimethylarginine dimethylaminohydrolase [Homoserinimonas sp.]